MSTMNSTHFWIQSRARTPNMITADANYMFGPDTEQSPLYPADGFATPFPEPTKPTSAPISAHGRSMSLPSSSTSQVISPQDLHKLDFYYSALANNSSFDDPNDIEIEDDDESETEFATSPSPVTYNTQPQPIYNSFSQVHQTISPPFSPPPSNPPLSNPASAINLLSSTPTGGFQQMPSFGPSQLSVSAPAVPPPFAPSQSPLQFPTQLSPPYQQQMLPQTTQARQMPPLMRHQSVPSMLRPPGPAPGPQTYAHLPQSPPLNLMNMQQLFQQQMAPSMYQQPQHPQHMGMMAQPQQPMSQASHFPQLATSPHATVISPRSSQHIPSHMMASHPQSPPSGLVAMGGQYYAQPSVGQSPQFSIGIPPSGTTAVLIRQSSGGDLVEGDETVEEDADYVDDDDESAAEPTHFLMDIDEEGDEDRSMLHLFTVAPYLQQVQLPPSKTPCLDALAFCVLLNLGAASGTTDSNLTVTNCEQMLACIKHFCPKQNQTQNNEARIKALKRWFNGIPSKKKRAEIFLIEMKTDKRSAIRKIIKKMEAYVVKEGLLAAATGAASTLSPNTIVD